MGGCGRCLFAGTLGMAKPLRQSNHGATWGPTDNIDYAVVATVIKESWASGFGNFA